VALRAYDVRGKEQIELLRFLLGQIVRSPWKFLLPIDGKAPSASGVPNQVEEKH
jgi:hypothetical protein